MEKRKLSANKITASSIILVLTIMILCNYVKSYTVSANTNTKVLTQKDYENICMQYSICPEITEAIIEIEDVKNPTEEYVNNICISLISNVEDGGDLYDSLSKYNAEEGFADAVLERSYELEREHGK